MALRGMGGSVKGDGWLNKGGWVAQLGAHSLAMALFFIDYNILYEMLCKCIDGKTYSNVT